jgi:predicted MFS family arabinose efflux permease
VLGGSLFRVGVGAIPFLLPLMLQVGFGLNPLQSGILTFSAAVGALFMKTLAATVLRAFGFRRVLVINAFICAVFVVLNGWFTPETPHAVIIAILLIGGCFRSLQFTSLNAISFADVPPRDMSYATSLTSMVQQLALSTGVALGAFVLESVSLARGHATLTGEDFAPAFLVIGALSALSVLFFTRLDPDAGAEMSGHRTGPRRPAAAE